MENENQQNQQTPQPQYQQTLVIVGKQKSVGVAFLLAFLFGPLGLLYASVTGGIVMFILGILIAIVTFGFGLIFVWIGCIIWAIIAANNANKKMTSGAGININTNFGNPISQQQQPPTTQNFNPQPKVQQQYSEQQSQQSQANIGETASKSINAFGDWVTSNKKGLLIGAGSILGLAILFVAVKFILSMDFKDNSSQQQIINQTQSNEPTTNQNNTSTGNESSMTENQFIIDTYLGTIGNKDFKLFIEKVDGESVEGYNVTGTNRRPIKGRIVNKWTEPTGLGGNYTIFKLILTEPGDDKWDGEFNIDLWISDIGRHGKGNWKSFNGKLERNINIKDRLNE